MASNGLLIPDYLLGGVLWALGRFIRERDVAGQGVPAEVRAAHRWLTTMSAIGHQSDCDAEQLDMDELIGADEAATLLGCSVRHVRRIHKDLDGARPAGRHLVFRRRSVIDYAEARKDHQT